MSIRTAKTKKVKLNKEKMEQMCRNANMAPKARINVRGYEVFIADGFSKLPHIQFQKFGCRIGEFPSGAYCTIWFATKGEGDLILGNPLIFDAMHDLNLGAERHQARLNSAKKDAERTIDSAIKVSKQGRLDA